MRKREKKEKKPRQRQGKMTHTFGGNDFLPIRDLPKQQRFVFRIRYNGTPTAGTGLK
jgi:hypothetical protein